MDWFTKIKQLRNSKERLILGLMSGTSVDGLDVALCKIKGFGKETKVELLHFETYGYSPFTKKQIHLAFDGTSEQICRLNFTLSRTWVEFLKSFLQKYKIQKEKIGLISSHGQTIYHIHQNSTLQIGEASVLAEFFENSLVISDFRVRDVAANGSGAPLVPFVDSLLFTSQTQHRVLQNIGGMSNLTFLAADGSEEVIAFDTGPGNAIIDEAVTLATNGEFTFDKDGKISIGGKVRIKWVEQLVGNSYFSQKPPKSCGRENFGKDFVHDFITMNNVDSFLDLARTFVYFVSWSISSSYLNFLPFPPDEVFISGGGALNKTLLYDLQTALGKIPVKQSDELGISLEAKEAIAFAVLANETLFGNASNLPQVTGAKHKVVLGKICF
ncbi:anhydro-N-acetylmuramic acid kinase [bacterium]|nr:anhydro-N-acetylmuramic acid kinase [bacterium]